MSWKHLLLAISAGGLEHSVLSRIEYLQEENRILRGQIEGRIRLTDGDRRVLAEKAVALGILMADTVTIVKPDTILKWHRRLVAKKFTNIERRRKIGRPKTGQEVTSLILRVAEENPSWGYDRIAGAVRNVGYRACDQTVGNIMKEHGLLAI